MIRNEHPNPLAILDAVIADMRASGDTGHVENLLQARADFAALITVATEYRQGSTCHVSDCVYCHDRNIRMDLTLAHFGSKP